MNVRKYATVLLPFLALLAAGGSLQAQPPYTPQPRFSPYLNLNRPGTPAGINYYGLVRPEFEFRRSIQQLQNQNQAQQQSIDALQSSAVPPPTTGHAVGFLNEGVYFQNLGSAATTVSSQPRTTGTVQPARSRR
jgi:hypothetical protein